MANAIPATFGPNNTPLTTIRNTAVASWEGFVYQGLCALYVALLMIKKDLDGSKDLLLGLEGYEDFVIQDGAGKILEFHQCKSYKQPVDFSDEFKKMEDKRAYWHSKSLCGANVPLYFHCNQPLTFSHGVQAYTYHNTANVVSPVGIYGLIKDVVNLILHVWNIPGSHVVKTAQLIYLIDRHVSWLHQISMNPATGQDQFDIVTTNPIRFSQLVDILACTSVTMTKQELARCVRYYFQLWLEERMMMRNHVNDGRVRQFISLLNTADANQILDLVQSLCPDIPIGSDGTENELAASPRPNNLYQVFVETGEELTFPNLTWQREGNVFSPSTLGSDLYGDELSAKIVNNGNISSLLWDCRWIVGNVKEKVDDVREEAKKITTMPIDYTKFTKPGKLGLLTIKDFNDGNHK